VTEGASWIPPGVDLNKASVARVYDWWLGGEHNFRIDQDAARALISVEPKTRAVAREFRAFLIRAVRYLAAEAGIRQFLDIGSGIPTSQNVHQVAQEIAPGTRVVYVDNDDVAVAHGQCILAGNPDATVILADIRDPQAILDHPETRRLIDFSQPVGLLLSAILHFIPDSDDPGSILDALRAPLAPGSHIAVSQSCRDAQPDFADTIESAYDRKIDTGVTLRTREQILQFFKGFDLVDPGLVWAPEWHPDSPGDPASLWAMAGVGKLGNGPGTAGATG